MQSIKDILEKKKRKLEEYRGRKSVWKLIGDKILGVARYIMSFLFV